MLEVKSGAPFSENAGDTHQRLETWTLSSAIRLLISFPVADWPLMKNDELFDFALRVRMMTRLGLPFGPFNSISMKPASVPIFTKEFSSVARPSTCHCGQRLANGRALTQHTDGGKLRPRQIAHAIVLFPVPLGPNIMLRYGPGRNSTES